jgi:hypothetical protein
MNKFIELFKSWRRGEEIEGQVTLSLPTILLIIGVIVLLVWYAIR